MPKTILIVDDDPTTVKMLESFLTAHEFNVIHANNGDEGLALIASKSPDCIILDVQMPGMNGYTFVFECKKIKKNKDIPIIVLTAKPGMAEIFKLEGVKEYLTKPVTADSVLKEIKKYI